MKCVLSRSQLYGFHVILGLECPYCISRWRRIIDGDWFRNREPRATRKDQHETSNHRDRNCLRRKTRRRGALFLQELKTLSLLDLFHLFVDSTLVKFDRGLDRLSIARDGILG